LRAMQYVSLTSRSSRRPPSWSTAWVSSSSARESSNCRLPARCLRHRSQADRRSPGWVSVRPSRAWAPRLPCSSCLPSPAGRGVIPAYRPELKMPSPAASATLAARPALFHIQAGKRLGQAMFFAGLFCLMISTTFYLFQVERLTNRQLAALTHHLGQIVNYGTPPGSTGTWSSDASGTLVRLPEPGSGLAVLALDNAWLAAHTPVGTHLFVYWHGRVHALSLGDAGLGEALAIDPAFAGRLPLHGRLFVQVPLRWDDDPQSPWLVARQPLELPFSSMEIAASGLLLWATLATFIWLTVGLWLNKALQQIQYLAYHDPLTGLINREALRIGLTHMLAESRRNGSLLAVLYLDLDRFKPINDSLGHAVGDLVLQECARRLAACVRDTDFVARLGGDEFVVVIGELDNANAAAHIARKVIAALSRPIPHGERSLQSGASVGIAIFPGNAADPDSLLTQADGAMYAAKQSGRGNFNFYDTTLGERAEHRLTMEMCLRESINRRDFELHYQPIFNAASDDQLALHGFEALIRWNRQGKLVPPDEFIPLAEEIGLIVELGDWALGEACRQLRQWHDRFPAARQLTMSVNVSAKQLHNGNFAERVASTLRECALAPGLLVLELTESLYIDGQATITQCLEDLRRIGVGLAMDDFGTGYSALASLSRLPLDRLKIDRSFIRGLERRDDRAIVLTIIAIAGQLGLEIVAEGVETDEQARLLKQYGCRIQQGWLYGKAQTAVDLEGLLAAGVRSA
ncbi:MAG: EAL domain-containing protein, partial [Dechloromonas sp.]